MKLDPDVTLWLEFSLSELGRTFNTPDVLEIILERFDKQVSVWRDGPRSGINSRVWAAVFVDQCEGWKLVPAITGAIQYSRLLYRICNGDPDFSPVTGDDLSIMADSYAHDRLYGTITRSPEYQSFRDAWDSL